MSGKNYFQGLTFQKLLEEITGLCESYGWELILEGEWFFRFEREKREVDIYWNGKIRDGKYGSCPKAHFTVGRRIKGDAKIESFKHCTVERIESIII